MPFRTDTGGFEPGDDDMADFMNDIVNPFVTDAKAAGGLGWIRQVPVEGNGSFPNFNYMYSRGTVGSEAAPYWMASTTLKTLWIFTGNGINTAQQIYDQPGNPMNHPATASPPYADPVGSFDQFACQLLTTVVGPYDSYWLFGGATGEYLHVVLKVNSRQYRHFHVGLFTPLHPDLDPESFYVTAHCPSWLAPDNLNGASVFVSNSNNREHQPYLEDHRWPFHPYNGVNLQFVGQNLRNRGLNVYIPNFGTLGYDWYHNLSAQGNADGGARNQVRSGNSSQFADPTTKLVGDVNAGDDDVLFGVCQCSGFGDGLGVSLFSCEPTFTANSVPLVPIYVSLVHDFESDRRWSPVAQVPDIFRVNMKSLDAEQEILIGSDTYVVFPLCNKDSQNTLSGEAYTGYEGLAYKKITANAT